MSPFVRVASTSALADGEMKQVSAGDTEILLARVGGRFHACTAFCTHYGAPLADGVLAGCTVICPWHHAAFDVTTGALEEPPAADALRRFEVRVDGDDVLVRVRGDADAHGEGADYRESDGAEPPMADAEEGEDARTFVLVGGGAAAQAALEELRAAGFRGRIVVVTPEAHAPYDRTQLSKGYLGGKAGDEALPLRDEGFYARHGVDVMEGTEVSALDVEARTLTLEGGRTLRYDACLVATGGTPRRLDLPGADLPGVRVLRSWEDARGLVEAAGEASQAVVIGSSFIGMEAASSLVDRGLEVAVIGQDRVPFANVLGERVGRVFQAAAEEKGVRFHLSAEVEGIQEASEGGLEVRLKGGEAVEGALVLLGVGVRPATDFLRGHAFRRDDGGLETDARLALAPGLFAAGDVAAYPEARLGRRVRIEHWRLAQQHGRHAARAMLGERAPFEGVPFFWSGQFALGLRYVGHAEAWDETIIDGSLEDQKFIVYYVKGGNAIASASVGRDRDAAAFHALLRQGRAPSPADLREGADLSALLAKGA